MNKTVRCKKPSKEVNKKNCIRKFSRRDCWCTPKRLAYYDFSKFPIRSWRRRRLDCLEKLKADGTVL